MRGPDGIKLKKKKRRAQNEKGEESMDGGRKGLKEGGRDGDNIF